MPRFFYIIPGILNGTIDDARKWNYQAQVWLWKRAPEGDKAAGFDYVDGVVGGTVWLDSQAAMIADDLVQAQAAGFDLCVIAHSNGCRLILRALQLAPELGTFAPEGKMDSAFLTLHLLAPACNADCRVNGLNDAAIRGQLAAPGTVHLYVSSADEVLGLGPLVSYGTLGKTGPTHGSPELAGMLAPQVNRMCGHSDWVGRDYEATMEAIATAENL